MCSHAPIKRIDSTCYLNYILYTQTVHVPIVTLFTANSRFICTHQAHCDSPPLPPLYTQIYTNCTCSIIVTPFTAKSRFVCTHQAHCHSTCYRNYIHTNSTCFIIVTLFTAKSRFTRTHQAHCDSPPLPPLYTQIYTNCTCSIIVTIHSQVQVYMHSSSALLFMPSPCTIYINLDKLYMFRNSDSIHG